MSVTQSSTQSSLGRDPSEDGEERLRRRPLLGRWAVGALVTACGLVMVLGPLVEVLAAAFGDGMSGFHRVWNTPNLDVIVRNTLTLAAGSLAVAMVVGVTLAVAVNRLPARGRRLIAALPVVPLMVPSVAVVIGWTFLLSPTNGYLNSAMRSLPFIDGRDGPVNVYSAPWIIVITGFSLASFVFQFVSSGIQRVDTNLLAAAAISGASPVRILRQILLPLVRPSLVFAAITVLLLSIGQFTAPLLLGQTKGIEVVTTSMYKAVQAYPPDRAYAAALGVPIALLAVLLIPLQRRLLSGQERFVVVAGKGAGHSMSPARWARPVVLSYAFVAVVLPVSALLYVAFSPFWTGTIDFESFTGRHFSSVLGDERTWNALRTSGVTALVAVVLVLVLSYFLSEVATGLSGAPRWLRLTADLVIALPLSVPGVIFGLGFLLTYTGGPLPLYGTQAIFIVAYVTLLVPYGARFITAGRLALSPEFKEAASVFGAGPWRRIRTVELPLLRGALAAGAGLIFILAVQEFAASLMVRTAQNNVLGTLMYEYWTSGTYSEVAALALLMIAFTCVGAGLIAVAGGLRVPRAALSRKKES